MTFDGTKHQGWIRNSTWCTTGCVFHNHFLRGLEGLRRLVPACVQPIYDVKRGWTGYPFLKTQIRPQTVHQKVAKKSQVLPVLAGRPCGPSPNACTETAWVLSRSRGRRLSSSHQSCGQDGPPRDEHLGSQRSLVKGCSVLSGGILPPGLKGWFMSSKFRRGWEWVVSLFQIFTEFRCVDLFNGNTNTWHEALHKARSCWRQGRRCGDLSNYQSATRWGAKSVVRRFERKIVQGGGCGRTIMVCWDGTRVVV